MTEITRDSVLAELKKHNGEKAAQAICNAGLWTVPNIAHIMEFAGRDKTEIEKVIPVLLDIYKSDEQMGYNTDLDPLTLLDMAGYKAWYVTNEQEQNSIAGYFRDARSVVHKMTGGAPRTDKGELICTIYTNWSQGKKRFDDWYIIHAVKKEVLGDDKLPESEWHIKPSDNPRREDPYGTSVISIQILKTGGIISIKNRYNHTLKTEHPDNTYNSNPDNIIPGLSDSLRKHFGVDFTTTHAVLPYNFHLVNDQIVRFNYEINFIYFGPYYYVDGEVITKLKNDGSQLLFYRGFMLNMEKDNNQIISVAGNDVAFCNMLNEYIQGKKVRVTGAKGATKTILLDGERFMDIKDGKITFIHAPALNMIHLEPDGADLSGDLDFGAVNDLSLPDLPNVTGLILNPNAARISIDRVACLSGALDFSGVKILELGESDLSRVTDVKFNPNAARIRAGKGLKLSKPLDFSGVNELFLNGADLTKVTHIKFNPNADSIELSGTKLSGNLDFSNVKKLILSNADLTKVTGIKFNPNADSIELSGTKLFGNLDFSGVEYLDLSGADLSQCTSVKYNPNADTVVLNDKTILGGDVNFGNVKNINGWSMLALLSYIDFSNVTGFKLPDNLRMDEIGIKNAVKLRGDLDLRRFQKINIKDSNLSYVNLMLNPNSGKVVFDGVNGVRGELNMAHVTNIHFFRSDLSHVTGLKLNPSAAQIEIKETKGLSGNLDFSAVRYLRLEGLDLAKVNGINFGRSEEVYIENCKNLNGNIDLSGCKQVNMMGTDFSHATGLKLPSRISVDGLKGIVAPNGILDISEMNTAVFGPNFTGSDLSRVTDLRLPVHVRDVRFDNAIMPIEFNCATSTDWLYFDHANFSKTRKVNISGKITNCLMRGASGLHGALSFVGVEKNLELSGSNLSCVTDFKLPKYLPVVNFNNAVMPQSKFHISTDTDWLGCGGSDFSKTENIIISGKVKKCVMRGATGLHGDLDFSNIKEIDLTDADLSKVRTIKFAPNAKVWGIKPKDSLRFALVKGIDSIKKKLFSSDKKQNQEEEIIR